jgi:hypothetical protein
MECHIHESINYLRLPVLLKEQKERVIRKIEENQPKTVYPGLTYSFFFVSFLI